jgi:hypothetical protein
MKRFLVVTDSGIIDDQSRNAITALLQARGWSVWHWFQDLWLVDSPATVDLAALRDQILRIPGTKRIMIMSTEGAIEPAGFVQKDAIPWIVKHWTRR